MTAPTDPQRDAQLVKLARHLERVMGRRRKLLAQLEVLDADIRTTRNLIRSMTSADDGS